MANRYRLLKSTFRNDKVSGKRCASRLLNIRKSLTKSIPAKSDSTLLLATWNIRDFDSNKFKWGPRLPETFFYIAEMISHFDLVAVQEVNRDLRALERVMEILGREWDYIATDTTAGAGGNDERMAFIYNTEKVWFRKIAGEVVLPDGQLIVSQKKVKLESSEQPDIKPVTAVNEMKQQFARSPFLVAFQSGWFKFSLCTVHIYFGQDSGPALKRRIDEIKKLVKFFADRQDKISNQDKDNLGNVENYILLGDFNVVSPQHETMKALKGEKFEVPAAIDGDKVRKKGQHYYDQIAVRVKDTRFEVLQGGILDMYEDVFRQNQEDMNLYDSYVPKDDPEANAKYRATTPDGRYKKWRTWQMSDHSPLWIQIKTDFSDGYLKQLAGEAPA